MKKFILFLAIGLLLSSVVFGDLSTNNILCYSFDDTEISGGTIIDLSDAGNDGTIGECLTGLPGKIGQTFYFDGTNDNIVSDSTHGISGDADRSLAFWYYVNASNAGGMMAIGSTSVGTNDGFNVIDLGGNFYLHGYSGDTDWGTGVAVASAGWHQVIWTYNSTSSTYEFYFDGSRTGTGHSLSANLNTPDTYVRFGFRIDSSDFWAGYLDEAMLWSRTIGADEIAELYNGGSGIACDVINAAASSLSLNTNLVNGTDPTNVDPWQFEINGTCISCTSDIVNLSVYVDDSLNNTFLNVNITDGLVFNVSTTNVTKWFNVTFNASNSEVSDANGYYFYYFDTINPIFTNVAGFTNNTIYYKNGSALNFNWNITISDANLYAYNYTLKHSNGSTYLNKFAENLGVTTSNNVTAYSLNNLLPGTYNIVLQGWDDHTKNNIDEKDYNPKKDLIKKELEFNQIKIRTDENIKDLDYKKLSDRYTFDFEFLDKKPSYELYLETIGSWVEREDISGYKGHLVDLSSNKWLDLEGEGHDVNLIKITDKIYKAIITPQDGKNDNLFSFESIGDLNSVELGYNITLTEGFTISAIDVLTNATINNFSISVFNTTGSLVDSQTTTNGVLVFNFTGNHTTNFTSSTHADNSTGNISFVAGGSFEYKVFATNSLYLFIYDEITDELITNPNVTIKIINYDNQSTQQVTGTGSLFYSGLTPGTYELRYSALGYNTRSYYTIISDASTQSIELYLLNSSEATYTSFIIEDETGNTLEGRTLKAYRHFIDCNCFKVVEMDKSTFNGVATLSLQQQEARYRFSVSDIDLSTIYSSTSTEGYKITDTAYTLTASLLGDTTESYFGTSGLYQNLSFSNSTKQFYFTVIDSESLVDQFCLYIDQYDLGAETGKNRICSNCVNASSGMAICNVTAYTTNGREMVARGWIHTNTQYSEYWTDVISEFTDLEAVTVFGKLGVFLGFLIILCGFFAGLILAGFGGAIIVMDIVIIFVSILKLIMVSFPVMLGLLSISVMVLILLGDK